MIDNDSVITSGTGNDNDRQRVPESDNEWQGMETSDNESQRMTGKEVLIHFAKFTGKYLCLSLSFNKVVGCRAAN